jgi:hypothetical protein
MQKVSNISREVYIRRRILLKLSFSFCVYR